MYWKWVVDGTEGSANPLSYDALGVVVPIIKFSAKANWIGGVLVSFDGLTPFRLYSDVGCASEIEARELAEGLAEKLLLGWKARFQIGKIRRILSGDGN